MDIADPVFFYPPPHRRTVTHPDAFGVAALKHHGIFCGTLPSHLEHKDEGGSVIHLTGAGVGETASWWASKNCEVRVFSWEEFESAAKKLGGPSAKVRTCLGSSTATFVRTENRVPHLRISASPLGTKERRDCDQPWMHAFGEKRGSKLKLVLCAFPQERLYTRRSRPWRPTR